MAAVDTTIDPHPTGAAATFASAHSFPNALTLYGAWFCPFVQRAWIVLREKGVPHRYVEVNPYQKPRSLLDLNPRGLVPTLHVPGGEPGQERGLYESLVVCEYLDEAFGEGGEKLLRGDAWEKARCRLWIDHVATRIVPGFYRVLQHTKEKPYSIAEAREEFLGHIKTFVREMDPKGPWFLGERFSLVDVALAPWAKRLFVVDHYKDGGSGVPGPEGVEGIEGEDKEVWKRWRVWFEAVEARQSVRDTWSDDEEYIKVYKRYADDTTQSLVGQATREGKRLP